MHDGWDVRFLIGKFCDHTAVVAGCSREALKLSRRSEGNGAAEAEAYNSDRTTLSQSVDGSLRVAQHRVEVRVHDEFHGRAHVLRRVPNLEAALLAVKQ